MEFMCVLSVDGSLTTYRVQKKSKNSYAATLRTTNGKGSDVPPKFTLEKNSTGWSGRPPHEEIIRSLVNAIEAKDGLDDKTKSPVS